MKTIFYFVFLLSFFTTFSQSKSEANLLYKNASASLRSNDSKILNNANYILSHPVDSLDFIRDDAMGSVLLWMYSTPNYVFYVDETITPFIREDNEILAIYMVAMVQTVLENPKLSRNHDEIKYHAFKKLLAYCEDPINRIKKSETISNAIYAMHTGFLKEYLKIS